MYLQVLVPLLYDDSFRRCEGHEDLKTLVFSFGKTILRTIIILGIYIF